MSYAAKVIADSVSRGHRLTTLQITFPRIILAEFNTHRMFSRNSASSRAIPVEKRIASLRQDPFVPEAFEANKAGMQGGSALAEDANEKARSVWIDALANAITCAGELAAIGVHKHWANRLIEFGSWHTVVVSATERSNYDALRDHGAAAPEIRTITRLMKEALAASTPTPLAQGQWHLPYIDNPYDGDKLSHSVDVHEAELAGAALGISPLRVLRAVSTGRCAAVSYERQESTSFDKAFQIYGRLKESGHMSPFEHPARPMTQFEYEELFNQPELEWTGEGLEDGWKEIGRTHYCGNFQGFVQERKMIPGEADFGRIKT